MYQAGRGVGKDFAQAIAWFEQAAEKNYAGAHNNIGVMYRDGDGVERDTMKAEALFRKAAELGDAWARYTLGVMYREGNGVARNFSQAIAWFNEAADQGLVDAEATLGDMYREDGQGQDLAKAVTYYRKAAEGGHGAAQTTLGAMFAMGSGVAQEFAQAAHWHQKAAEKGIAQAQYNLGLMFCKGDGVAQDYNQAAAWWQKAEAQGHALAASDLRQLNAYLAKGEKNMSDQPRLIGLILCELILQDVLRRDAISCINIHTGVIAPDFPVTLPLIYGYAAVTGVTKEAHYQFKVADERGKVIADTPLTKIEPGRNVDVHKIINAFTSLTFESEGVFWFVSGNRRTGRRDAV